MAYGRRRVRFPKRRYLRRKRAARRVLAGRPMKRRRMMTKKKRPSFLGGVFTPRRFALIPYVDNITAVQVVAADLGIFKQTTDWIWRANSVYDPKYAASGTYNQSGAAHKFFSTLYNHYMVTSSTITVTIRQVQPVVVGTNNNNSDIMCCLWEDDDALNSMTRWSDLISHRNARIATMHCTPDAKGKVVLRLHYGYRKTFRSRPEEGGSTTDNNPVDQSFFMLGFQFKNQLTPSYNSPQMEVSVRINYRVVYTEPKDVDILDADHAMIQV